MIVPPPWSLSGNGYVLILAPTLHLPVPIDLGTGNAVARGPCGFGVLMALDYTSSTVGPYRELLYIPGHISVRCRTGEGVGGSRKGPFRGHSISDIWVTTEDSRAGGAANWGIPKRLGRLICRPGKGSTRQIVLSDTAGTPLLQISISHAAPPFDRLGKVLSIPFSHRFLPRRLLQATHTHLFSTSIEASGRAWPVFGVRVAALSERTAGIGSRRILAAFRLAQVTLRFPIPELQLPFAELAR